MRPVFTHLYCVLAGGFLAGQVHAARPVPEIIDEYVDAGLRTNLSLQATTLEVDRASATLDSARARFFPVLSLEGRYTRNEGGRLITLPIGPPDQQPSFAITRPREQDTRLTLRQPLYAPAIPAAVRAQRAALSGSEYARIALARRLKRDISVGYLGWLQANKAIAIVESSRGLLQENLRVTESLFRNGKITQDQVLRARAELLAVEQQLRTAQNNEAQSHSYLNFLLNRKLDAALESAEPDAALAGARADLETLRSAAIAQRPELQQSSELTRAATAQVDIARAANKPTLSLGVDAGIQGERYEFGRGRNFSTISLLLNWKLFDAGQRHAEVRAASASARVASTRHDELAQQVQLEVQQALDSLSLSIDSLATAEARAVAARAGFHIASRKRDEGAISQVEFIDSRNALTAAELNLNVTHFELLARQAELDYATASGKLPAAIGVLSP